MRKWQKNLISGWLVRSKFAPTPSPQFFPYVLPLLEVKSCRQLLLYAISREKYDPNSTKWQKTSLWAIFRPVMPNFRPPFFFFFSFLNLTSSYARYYDLPSSCTISEKLMIQSWENLVTDEQTDRATDGRTDRRTRVIS